MLKILLLLLLDPLNFCRGHSTNYHGDYIPNYTCGPFDCGKFTSIGFPFYKSDVQNGSKCGLQNFKLHCQENGVVRLMTEVNRSFEVKELSLRDQRLLLVDTELIDALSQNKCTLPLEVDYAGLGYSNQSQKNTCVKFTRCENSAPACTANGLNYRYGVERCEHSLGYKRMIMDKCWDPKRYAVRLDSLEAKWGEVVEVIRDGFYVTWPGESNRTSAYKIMIGILMAILVLAVISSWVLKHISKKKAKASPDVEDFLKDYKALMPTRYSYADIKKITNGHCQKLGQGGSGCVFKGKLSNGDFVAVKVLNKSSDCTDAFINEVATMGRIHHVNVVSLLGFCSEGHKRALVYEFMPNGSLEKFIYTKGARANGLGWEKIYEIALGISRGIWYLHQGCNIQIMHFDIKPHNILLDSNFNPKISDFGLAKSCSKESTISIMAARGTLGYIAPELFSKSFGSVSCKSDMYSYGMLILEMVGRRKNDDVDVENPSQVYFPAWAYDQLRQWKKLGQGEMTKNEEEIVKKMAIVGLWCIQMNPAHRPSMNMVVQMLEGSLDSLQMPPKPFVSPHRDCMLSMILETSEK
ncbi:rust resistance kinase Lr10-like [Magnolia sinica]|uniref:rust resistance kinase Lr10-like n=1 Tax=Magnolia sinica TaxID=86752 RepID=UPI002659CF0B|nr:rust resistance kinase Lr10-like [Magnolia sinica]